MCENTCDFNCADLSCLNREANGDCCSGCNNDFVCTNLACMNRKMLADERAVNQLDLSEDEVEYLLDDAEALNDLFEEFEVI